MSTRIRIGIACPNPGERAAFIEWLDASGYEPVPMLEVHSIVSGIETRPMEALIIDNRIAPASEMPALIRALGPNRPVILVGEQGTAPAYVNRDASWLDRPVAYESFLMSVALALAEGRPGGGGTRQDVGSPTSSLSSWCRP
jgi:DNA-binding NtrC family response regulator